MKRVLHLVLLSSIVLGVTCGTLAPSAAQNNDTATLVADNNTFAFDFYRQVAAETDTNLLFSPFSISQAFGMLMAAARENTETQMAATLRYTLPQDALHPAFAALNADLSTRQTPDAGAGGEGERLQLNVANSIWAQDGFPFRDAYMNLLRDFYNGGLRFMDFVQESEAARETINDWVEDETEDKIQNMLPQGVINPDTRLVLVNAIYFNGSWQHPFVESATQDEPFTLLDGSTVNVPMMFQQESLGYLRGDGFQVVELPYFGYDMAMLIVLPDADQFEAVQRQLDGAWFESTRREIATQDVQLFMPRFEFETALDLKTTLQNMGMTDVFDGNLADLTGMFDPATVNGNLFVTDALHKAFIGVDETGTEAAAATAIVVGITSAPMPSQPVEVRLDHPFIYAIYDRQTGAILFLGQVLNPAG
ncbi:MAG: serpin family protein [Anaerolineae bacterium]|nr:serpin family protein [Anaerolineae bacterium]